MANTTSKYLTNMAGGSYLNKDYRPAPIKRKKLTTPTGQTVSATPDQMQNEAMNKANTSMQNAGSISQVGVVGTPQGQVNTMETPNKVELPALGDVATNQTMSQLPKLPTLGNTGITLSPTPPVSNVAPEVAPVNNPTLENFITEAQKITDPAARMQYINNYATKAEADILNQNAERTAETFARQLYGGNLGATSGVGKELTARAVADQAKRLEPYARQRAADFATSLMNQSQEQEANKIDNIMNMIDNGQMDYESLTPEDKGLLSKYKGIPVNMPFKSRAEMEEKSNNVNRAMEGVLNGYIKGPEAKQIIADAYGVPVEQITLPSNRADIIKQYTDAQTAMGLPVNYSNLNNIIKMENVAEGLKPGDEGYMELFTMDEIIENDPFVDELFGYTAGKNIDSTLNSLLKATPEFSNLDLKKDIKPTPENRAKFRKLYKTNPSIKDYIDSKYGGIENVASLQTPPATQKKVTTLSDIWKG